MTTFENYEVKTDRLTIPLLVWRRFRRPMIGMAERILALNPGIADQLAYLDLGTKVTIPIDPPRGRSAEVPVVQLWD